MLLLTVCVCVGGVHWRLVAPGPLFAATPCPTHSPLVTTTPSQLLACTTSVLRCGAVAHPPTDYLYFLVPSRLTLRRGCPSSTCHLCSSVSSRLPAARVGFNPSDYPSDNGPLPIRHACMPCIHLPTLHGHSPVAQCT